MEPSQFVSVVPKYPDKMGFDEVGKVSVCVRTCVQACNLFVCLYRRIGLSIGLGANEMGLAAEKALRSWEKLLTFCCASVFLS